MQANPAVELTFTMTGQQPVPAGKPGLAAGVPEGLASRAAADRGTSPGSCMGASHAARMPGVDGVPAAAAGAADQHRRDRRTRRASSPTRSPASIPKEVYDAAGKLMAEDARSIPGFLVRQLATCSTTRRISRSTSCAIRRKLYGVSRDADPERCCATRTRRTTST